MQAQGGGATSEQQAQWRRTLSEWMAEAEGEWLDKGGGERGENRPQKGEGVAEATLDGNGVAGTGQAS